MKTSDFKFFVLGVSLLIGAGLTLAVGNSPNYGAQAQVMPPTINEGLEIKPIRTALPTPRPTVTVSEAARANAQISF